jgi:hypothetical protein
MWREIPLVAASPPLYRAAERLAYDARFRHGLGLPFHRFSFLRGRRPGHDGESTFSAVAGLASTGEAVSLLFMEQPEDPGSPESP